MNDLKIRNKAANLLSEKGDLKQLGGGRMCASPSPPKQDDVKKL